MGLFSTAFNFLRKKFLDSLCWCRMWSRNLRTGNLETEGSRLCWRAGPPCFQSDSSPLPVWGASSLADSISLDLTLSNNLPCGFGKSWSLGIVSLLVYIYLISQLLSLSRALLLTQLASRWKTCRFQLLQIRYSTFKSCLFSVFFVSVGLWLSFYSLLLF